MRVFCFQLYVAENWCKGRVLPKHSCPWLTVYVRMGRWAEKTFLDKIFECQRHEQLITLKPESVSLDSTARVFSLHADKRKVVEHG
jgi:hypothetical protein